jgi:hypothetical protein
VFRMVERHRHEIRDRDGSTVADSLNNELESRHHTELMIGDWRLAIAAAITNR